MARENYYSVLEISRHATQEEIEAAYRRLSRLYDPSQSKKRQAARRAELVNEAYSVLNDKKRRAEYDRWLLSGKARSGVPFGVSEEVAERIRLVGRRWMWAGAAAGAAAVVVAVVLIATLGGGEETETAASGDTSATQTPAASVTPAPGQTPTTPGP